MAGRNPTPSSRRPGSEEGLAPSREAALGSLGHDLDALSARFEQTGALGLLVVDTSCLLQIERSFGASAHRQVMARVADRVRELIGSALASGDCILRGEMGRDELLVLLFRPRKEVVFYREELPQLALTLAEALSAPGSRLAYPFHRDCLRFSAGSAVALCDPTLRPEFLLRRAREQAIRKAEIQRELDASARRDRFVSLLLAEQVTTVFEPIVRLTSREVFGYEALVRGVPGAEFSSPKELFDVATETDTLFELDCLCRRMALQQANALPPGAKLFLNILPSAIHDPAFQGDALCELLQDHRLQPQDLVFEISERETISNFSIFREFCDRYTELGFQIALDDIGVGYSSLEAVAELHPDFLKIDMSFVRRIHEDPACREILAGLNAVARRIGAQMIAEGIETAEELEAIRGLAVPFGQGYFLGRAGALTPGA